MPRRPSDGGAQRTRRRRRKDGGAPDGGLADTADEPDTARSASEAGGTDAEQPRRRRRRSLRKVRRRSSQQEDREPEPQPPAAERPTQPSLPDDEDVAAGAAPPPFPADPEAPAKQEQLVTAQGEITLDADDIDDRPQVGVQREPAPLPGTSAPAPSVANKAAAVACFSVVNDVRVTAERAPRFAGWYAQSAVTGKFRPTNEREQGGPKVTVGESLGSRPEDPTCNPGYLRQHLEWARILFSHLRAVLVVLCVYQHYTLLDYESSLFLSRYAVLSDVLQKLFNVLSGCCLALALLPFAVQSVAGQEAVAAASRKDILPNNFVRRLWQMHLGFQVLCYAGVVVSCLATAAFDDWIWELRVDLHWRLQYPSLNDNPVKLRPVPPPSFVPDERCGEWVQGLAITGSGNAPAGFSMVAVAQTNVSVREQCLWLCEQDRSCAGVSFVETGPLAHSCYKLRFGRLDTPRLLATPTTITNVNGETTAFEPQYIPLEHRTGSTISSMWSFLHCGCYHWSDGSGARASFVQLGPLGSGSPGCGGVGQPAVSFGGGVLRSGCLHNIPLANCRMRCSTTADCAAYEWDPHRGTCQLNDFAQNVPTGVLDPPHHKQLFCTQHVCQDAPGWRNADGQGCDVYFREGWCSGGRFVAGFDFGAPGRNADECARRGSVDCASLHNHPAENCCECGRLHPGGTAGTDSPAGVLAPPADVAHYCMSSPVGAPQHSVADPWMNPLAPPWFNNGTDLFKGTDDWHRQTDRANQCRLRGCCYCPDCVVEGLHEIGGASWETMCYFPPADPVRVPLTPESTHAEAETLCREQDRQLCYAADICDSASVLAPLREAGPLGEVFAPVGDGENSWIPIGDGSGCGNGRTPQPKWEWWGQLNLNLPHRQHAFCCRPCPLWERPGARQLDDRTDTFRAFATLRLAFAIAGFAYGFLTELVTVPRVPRPGDEPQTGSRDATSQRGVVSPSRRHRDTLAAESRRVSAA